MVRKEEILARTSNGLDVFRHYLPVKWRVGRNFLNPLYEDSKASCNVYYDRRSGTYRMKDFGNGDFSGDCFFIVAKIKGLDCKNAADFVEILETIDRELCLGISEDVPPFTEKELEYWAGYGITEAVLNRYGVQSLKEYRSETKDGKEFGFTSTAIEPMFGYAGKWGVKV